MTPIVPLTLYVNPAWHRNGIHTPLLIPWWGNPYGESSLFAKQTFDMYSFDTNYYVITDDIQKADMILPPYPHVWFLHHDTALFDECVRTAREANLPLLIDGVGDIDYPIKAQNAFILRYGGYSFLPEHGRIQIPPLVDDLLERCMGGQLRIRKKQEGKKPIVGFAGWAALSTKQKIRTLVKELPLRLHGLIDQRYRTMTKGVFWRAKAVHSLQGSPKVELNLKARASFSGSTKTAQGDLLSLRKEFVDTILGSDYGLEVRGDPNTSSRLFEICSLGRIPVVIDTERNFPWSDVLNYRDFCVIVDYRDIKRLPDIIADFHARVTSEQFENMQRKAREIFVGYFRVDALMQQVIRTMKVQQAKDV